MCYYVLIWTVDDITNFKIYLGSSSKAMADREKREGKMEIQKLVEIIMSLSSVDFLKVELRNIYTKRLSCLADFGR